MTTLFTILFDGVAYGMLLFVLACGLAVTLGLMNFVNLAHGAFAMTGGYVCAVLVNQSGWPFFAGLPLAFVASALIGAVLERSIVWNRARIGERATLRDAIVGEGYTVADDTTLVEEIVANEPIAPLSP